MTNWASQANLKPMCPSSGLFEWAFWIRPNSFSAWPSVNCYLEDWEALWTRPNSIIAIFFLSVGSGQNSNKYFSSVISKIKIIQPLFPIVQLLCNFYDINILSNKFTWKLIQILSIKRALNLYFLAEFTNSYTNFYE